MDSHDSPCALVTGGGTGVGRATALQLARRGFNLAINYSRSRAEAEATAHEVEALGQTAVVVQADVASDEQSRKMVETCQSTFGRLDVVVNNAGRTHFVDLTDLDGLTESMWEEILGVNVKGAFFVSRAAAPLLRASDQAAIVNVASVAGIAGSGSSLAYAASKGAMITMTKSLARALAPTVRVNAVCPGVIVSRWLADHQEMIDAAIRVTPLNRASLPEDIAGTICFLACDAGMMTGQALVVDGGRTM